MTRRIRPTIILQNWYNLRFEYNKKIFNKLNGSIGLAGGVISNGLSSSVEQITDINLTVIGELEYVFDNGLLVGINAHSSPFISSILEEGVKVLPSSYFQSQIKLGYTIKTEAYDEDYDRSLRLLDLAIEINPKYFYKDGLRPQMGFSAKIYFLNL